MTGWVFPVRLFHSLLSAGFKRRTVRSVKPVLRPVLRSGHGRRGVSHGAGDVGSGTRVVLATGSGTLAAERPVGAGLLPGRGRQRAAVLLVAAQARADRAQGAGLRPGARRHRTGRRARDAGHRGGPGQRPVPPCRAGVRPPHPRGARRPPGGRGGLMLSLPPTVRIYLAAQPTDLRKSFDSLAAVVREGLQGDPMSGDIFVFRNKAADRIKLLVWEEDGYASWYKRLESGRYRFPLSLEDQPRVEVRAADLIMLLEGIDLSSVKRGKRYHRPVARAAI